MPSYFDCGFSVREPSWHGREDLLLEPPKDWPAAREAAGLSWEPVAVPAWGERHLTIAQIAEITAETPDRIRKLYDVSYDRPDTKYPVMIAETEFQRIIRDDSEETLAVPTDTFSPISHAQMGEIIEAVGETGLTYETAGSVRGGRQVWALMRLDEPFEVFGDKTQIYPFLVLLNAHDRSAACSIGYTAIRVVCWNTWSAADAEGARSGARFVFRHTGNVAERIEQAKAALGNLRKEADETRRMFEALAQTPVNDEQVKTFTQLFLPSPADRGEFCSDRVAANVEKARTTFGRLYDESLTTEGIRGSAFGLLQASTEYLDHVRTFRTSDSYVGRTLLRPEALKGRALALIGEITGN